MNGKITSVVVLNVDLRGANEFFFSNPYFLKRYPTFLS